MPRVVTKMTALETPLALTSSYQRVLTFALPAPLHATLDTFYVSLTGVATGAIITGQFSSDTAGDEPILPETVLSYTRGVTTPTRATIICRIGAPISDTDGTVYLWLKSSLSATVTQGKVIFTELKP